MLPKASEGAEERLSPPESSIYVARQPIFARDGSVFAYELLFRDGVTGAFPETSGDFATRALLLNTYIDIGLDKIAGNQRIFVNFTAETLLGHVPLMFPKEKLVIEILENVEPTLEVVTACEALAAQGYLFALDDFVYDERFQPLMDLASFVKLDFLATEDRELERVVGLLQGGGRIELLAEKVETREQYQRALDLGFSYFQGYFFSRPELFQSKSLRSVKVNLLQVLAEIARPDFDLDLIEQAIARDVSISYKLLRYINSALFNTVNEISTIRHAILLLGRKEFRNFIGLLLTGEIASDKPLELTRVALVRGRFCEQIAIQSGKSKESSEYFLLGLFSLLDAMLDTGMAVVLEKLPLQERLKQALLTDEGELAEYLKLVRAYERGDWQGINDLLELLELGDADSMMCYLDAIAWGDQMVNLKPAD